MELPEAVTVVRALASGVDPQDSKALPDSSILRRAQIVTALNKALTALVQAEERARTRPANAGRYWSKEEDAKVCEEVRSGMDFQRIAKAHNRTVGSIVARLVKLGRISPSSPLPQAV